MHVMEHNVTLVEGVTFIMSLSTIAVMLVPSRCMLCDKTAMLSDMIKETHCVQVPQ
jgi:hypothetical protein